MRSNWNRYPGGKQISTGRGERIRKWFQKRWGRTFDIGLTFRAVTFADHRSGWSGVNMHVGFGWWGFGRTILAWKNGPREDCRLVTLAEQISRTHAVGPSLERQEELEAEEKADERARMELFNKQLREWDARQQQTEGE